MAQWKPVKSFSIVSIILLLLVFVTQKHITNMFIDYGSYRHVIVREIISSTAIILSLLNILVILANSFSRLEKRLMSNLQVGVFAALFYAFALGVSLRGLLSAVVLGSVTALLYTAITQKCWRYCIASNKIYLQILFTLSVCAVMYLLRPVLTNNWPTFYVLFQYSEPDPLGPALGNFYIYLLAIIFYLLHGVTGAIARAYLARQRNRVED